MAESRCDVVATDKPQVWKDDHGWNCDQTTICRTCLAISIDRLAEGETFPEAIAATAQARRVVSCQETLEQAD